jgi:hypothetical protein
MCCSQVHTSAVKRPVTCQAARDGCSRSGDCSSVLWKQGNENRLLSHAYGRVIMWETLDTFLWAGMCYSVNKKLSAVSASSRRGCDVRIHYIAISSCNATRLECLNLFAMSHL